MTAAAPRPHPLTERLLGDADLPAVIALHHQARAALPPDQVAAETDAFFADHLHRMGRILGLHDGTRLVAYAVLGLPRPGDPNFAAYLDLPAEDWPGVAHLDGVSVASDWRGCGLHRRLIRARLALAAAAGRRLALSTVAPENLPSLGNGLTEGLDLRRLRRLYGGWRFVTGRRLAAPRTPPDSAPDDRWLEVRDLKAQGRLLDAGWRGIALRQRDHGSAEILYRRPSTR